MSATPLVGSLAHDPSNQPAPIDLARAKVEEITGAADAWLAKVPEITTAAVASRAQDFDNQLRAVWQQTDDQRDHERAPHLRAAAAVQAAWTPLLATLAICRTTIKAKLDAWKLREQARLDAERAAALEVARIAAEQARRKAISPQTIADMRQAEEAAEAARAAAAAVAAIPERAQVRGELGGRATSLRRYRYPVIEDIDEVFLHYRGRPELAECLVKLANADLRRWNTAIPGIRIVEELR